MEPQQRIVALAVGDKRGKDTRFLFRYAYAHLLEPDDRVVVLHARIGAPAGWVPLTVGQAVGSDEAGWLPEEMRQGLKSFKHSEYWQLKGLSAADAIVEFGAPRALAPSRCASLRFASLASLRLALRRIPSLGATARVWLTRLPSRAQSRRAACARTCWWWARAATAA